MYISNLLKRDLEEKISLCKNNPYIINTSATGHWKTPPEVLDLNSRHKLLLVRSRIGWYKWWSLGIFHSVIGFPATPVGQFPCLFIQKSFSWHSCWIQAWKYSTALCTELKLGWTFTFTALLAFLLRCRTYLTDESSNNKHIYFLHDWCPTCMEREWIFCHHTHILMFSHNFILKV